MTTDESPPDRQSLLVRILAVPLIPFVALWELLRAAWRLTGRALRWLVSLPFRLIAAVWRHLLAPLFSWIGGGIRWLAGRLAALLLPILLRVGIVIRELARAAWVAARAVWDRLLVPLRVLGRLALQVLRRALLILRLVFKALWLALKAVAIRVSVPLRILARALARAMRWLGSALWQWFLAPIGRTLWMAFRAARRVVLTVARGLARTALVVFAWIRPALLIALRAVQAAARAAWAVLRVAWWGARLVFQAARTALRIVLSPVVRMWRVAATVVGASIEAVRSSLRAARLAVREAFHDSRNAVRAAFGREPLPTLAPIRHTRRRTRSVQKPTVATVSRKGTVAVAIPLVIVVSAVGFLAVGFISASRSPVTTPATPVSVTEQCPLLQPGGPVALSHDQSCGTLAAGRTLVGLHCSQLDRLPGTLAVKTYAGDNETSNLATKTAFDEDGCHLQVFANRDGELETVGTLPGGVMVIADFTPPAGALYDSYLFARCSGSGCVSTAVFPDGTAVMSEHMSSGKWFDLTRRRLKVLPGLNRVALWVGGALAIAWLNGAEIGRPTVAGGGNGGIAGFGLANRDEKPLDITVRQLAVLGLD